MISVLPLVVVAVQRVARVHTQAEVALDPFLCLGAHVMFAESSVLNIA